MNPTGTLYIVATPIGNLEDISLRALRILAEVSLIFCEDTRVTKKLLSHYNIPTGTTSFHLGKPATIKKLVDVLLKGNDAALVVDAGTPGISDPGAEVVAYIRQHYPDIKITSVPGPSALVAALSIAGVKTGKITFLGFPPQKKGRQTFFRELSERQAKGTTTVFYESSHRLSKALLALSEGLEDKDIVLIKELTKIHETVWKDSPKNLLENLSEPELSKGEFVIIIPAD